MSAREHTARGGIATSMLAGGASILAGLLLLPLVFATVGAAPYGVWLVLFAVVALTQYADLGVGAAIVHFGSRSRVDGGTRTIGDYLSAALLWNSVAAVAVIPAFLIVALVYTGSVPVQQALGTTSASWLAVIATGALASFLLRPFSSTLIGAGLLPLEQRNQLIATGVRVAGTIAVCTLAPNVVLLAIVEAAWVLLPGTIALVEVHVRRVARVRWGAGTTHLLRRVLSYSIRSFGASVVGASILQSGVIIAGIALGPASASYYSAGFRGYTAARQVLTWVIEPFRSAMSRLFVSDHDHAMVTLLRLSLVVGGLAATVSQLGILGSPVLVHLWLGSTVPTDEVAATLAILLAGLVLNSLYLPLGMAADSRGMPGLFFWSNVLWLVLTVGLSLGLGIWLGVVGVALGLSAPLLVIVPINLVRAKTRLGFTWQVWLQDCIRPVVVLFLAPGAFGGVVFVATYLVRGDTITASVIATGAYVLSQVTLLLIFRSSFRQHGLRELFQVRL